MGWCLLIKGPPVLFFFFLMFLTVPLACNGAQVPAEPQPQTRLSLSAAPGPTARLLEPRFLLQSRPQVLTLDCPASPTCLGPSSDKCLELTFSC